MNKNNYTSTGFLANRGGKVRVNQIRFALDCIKLWLSDPVGTDIDYINAKNLATNLLSEAASDNLARPLTLEEHDFVQAVREV